MASSVVVVGGGDRDVEKGLRIPLPNPYPLTGPSESPLSAAAPALVQSSSGKRIDHAGKKYANQVTGRHNDTAELHLAAHRGNLVAVKQILDDIGLQMVGTLSGADFDAEVAEARAFVVNAVNELGETALYAAAEKGHLGIVNELLKYANEETISKKNRLGFDPLHISAKQGHHEIVQVLLDHNPGLSKTIGPSNATPLISAAHGGHTAVVNELLQRDSSLLDISRSNGKNALHLASRQGHVAIVKALLNKYPLLARRTDKKGQTSLHKAAKGVNCEVVKLLLEADAAIALLPDSFGNTALHIAIRKKQAEIVKELLHVPHTNVNALTRDHKTALDIAEMLPLSEESSDMKDWLLRCGAVRAKFLNQPMSSEELRKTVTQIKEELKKLRRGGTDKGTNSVAVFFATIAFASLFTVPGGNDDDGMAMVVTRTSFMIFFFFNTIALFTSLIVIIVQVTLIRTDTKAERRLVEVIHKLMCLASVSTVVAFLASSYIVVGRKYEWAAILVTVVEGVIITGVLGTMTYYVVKSRINLSMRKKRNAA